MTTTKIVVGSKSVQQSMIRSITYDRWEKFESPKRPSKASLKNK